MPACIGCSGCLIEIMVFAKTYITLYKMKDITAYQQPKHNNNFDLMRLVGAFHVVLVHAYGWMWDPSKIITNKWVNHNLMSRSYGLIIFFTISGYLVSQSLLGSSSIKQYLLKRFLRIYPAYIVVSLILLLILGPLLTTLPLQGYFLHPLTRSFFFENMLILDSKRILPGVMHERGLNQSAWTITFELKLYWLLLVFFVIRKIQFKWIVTAAFITAVLIKIFIPLTLLQLWVYHDLRAWYTLGFYFLTGSFLFVWKDTIKLHYSGIIILAVFWWITDMIALPGNIAEVLIFPYIILWLCLKTKVLFNIKWDLSYGIYLYASPVQHTCFFLIGHTIPLWQFNLITVPIIMLFAILSWHLVEKKALALKYKS